MSHRIALIIENNYRNARTTGPLAILRYPAALRAELSEPNRDDFEVHDFVDQDGHTTIKQIYKIFETANSERRCTFVFFGAIRQQLRRLSISSLAGVRHFTFRRDKSGF